MRTGGRAALSDHATYLDDDADLSLVQDRHVAVLGYDGQARAHALCLRDSGVDVRVGLEAGSKQRDEAEADGLRVVSPYEACEEADLLVLSAAPPDAVVADVVVPNLVPGCLVVLGGDAELAVALPDGVDAVRIMPWGSGDRVRDEFSQGRGAPMFASVVVDATGSAWKQAMAYARAIGGTRAGVVRTSDSEYLLAHQTAGAFYRGRGLAAVRAAFEELVRAGCPSEVAYVEIVQGLQEFANNVATGAFDAELVSGAGDQPGPWVRAMMGWLRSGQHPVPPGARD